MNSCFGAVSASNLVAFNLSHETSYMQSDALVSNPHSVTCKMYTVQLTEKVHRHRIVIPILTIDFCSLCHSAY